MPAAAQAPSRASRASLWSSSSSFVKLLFVLLSVLLWHLQSCVVMIVQANRDVTPIHWNEELQVTTSLFTNHLLNATECFKYYFTQPEIMNVSPQRQPNWKVATVKMSAYVPGGRVGVCGKCLKVRTMNERHSVIVKIVGDCPTCIPDQIELTPAAFYELGMSRIYEEGRGLEGIKVLQTVYSFVACPEEDEVGNWWPHIPERQLAKKK
ncbi:MAG: hypothetical protein J3R72DRAFT_521189 [Linnemannia gamsii]|nr:MAG: hypothetical protein J3R72DRAFT_521189 [Linnemannia gamsii]